MADEEQRLRDIQREYLDFLDDEVNILVYTTIYYSKFVIDFNFCIARKFDEK